jgi:hypothetical protein
MASEKTLEMYHSVTKKKISQLKFLSKAKFII